MNFRWRLVGKQRLSAWWRADNYQRENYQRVVVVRLFPAVQAGCSAFPALASRRFNRLSASLSASQQCQRIDVQLFPARVR